MWKEFMKCKEFWLKYKIKLKMSKMKKYINYEIWSFLGEFERSAIGKLLDLEFIKA